MELDLLEEHQVFGYNRLNIFYKYGVESPITDLAILLGCQAENGPKYTTGYWWLKTNNFDYILVVDIYGGGQRMYYDDCSIGIRPIIKYSSNSSLINEIKVNNNKEFIYGTYPQNIIDDDFAGVLENMYHIGNLKTTGKNYMFNNYPEYECVGCKCIRVIGNPDINDTIMLSDNKVAKRNKVYWIRVSPIEWLIDEKDKIAITKKIILTGVPYHHDDYYYIDFKNTDLYKYMNTYLIKDMFDNVSINKKNDNNKEFVGINNKIMSLRKRIDNIRK